MPDSPPRLNRALLDALEARWRRSGAPIAALLRPGLDDAQMDDLTAPLGIRLPREARQWWGWHDGADPQFEGLDHAEIGPRRSFLPLAAVADMCLEWRVLAADEDIDIDWAPSWLPLDRDEAPIVLDCGVGYDAPIPVRSWFVEEPEVGARGVASFGALVELWIDAYDRGVWVWNAGENRWDRNTHLIDPAIIDLDLV